MGSLFEGTLNVPFPLTGKLSSLLALRAPLKSELFGFLHAANLLMA
jgi:hypothetical protein